MRYRDLVEQFEARGFTRRSESTDTFGVVTSAAWHSADGGHIVSVQCGDKLNSHDVQTVSAATTDSLGWAADAVGEKWAAGDEMAALTALLDQVR